MSAPFVWAGRRCDTTIGELLDAVCAIPDAATGAEFMDAYRAVTDHADENIGYIIGYVEPAARRRALYARLGVAHPIFGGAP